MSCSECSRGPVPRSARWPATRCRAGWTSPGPRPGARSAPSDRPPARSPPAARGPPARRGPGGAVGAVPAGNSQFSRVTIDRRKTFSTVVFAGEKWPGGDPLNDQTETITRSGRSSRRPDRLLRGCRSASSTSGRPGRCWASLAGRCPGYSGRGAGVDWFIQDRDGQTATAPAGPRFFHSVTGGSTPAALVADWVVSLLDQNAFVRASLRLADAVESVALVRLRHLAGLLPGRGYAPTASTTSAKPRAMIRT